jgi:hypothetical protein
MSWLPLIFKVLKVHDILDGVGDHFVVFECDGIPDPKLSIFNDEASFHLSKYINAPIKRVLLQY